MPISQSRMLELLEECERLHQDGLALRKEFARICQYARAGHLTDAVDHFEILLAQRAVPQVKAMFTERAHFDKTAKYNERAKRYQEAKRRAGGAKRQEATAFRAKSERAPERALESLPAYEPTPSGNGINIADTVPPPFVPGEIASKVEQYLAEEQKTQMQNLVKKTLQYDDCVVEIEGEPEEIDAENLF